MKRKRFRIFLLLAAVLTVLAGSYLALAYYYRDGFSYGTWVNGIYCTGKSITEINKELTERCETPSLTVVLKTETGEKVSVPFELTGIQYEVNFHESLVKLKNTQNPLLWGGTLFRNQSIVLLPERIFDFENAEKEIDAFLEKNAGNIPENECTVEIVRSEESGYVLRDTTKGLLDREKAKEMILMTLAAGEKTVNLADTPCYYDLPPTQEWKQTAELYEKIRAFQEYHFTYQFGDNREIVNESVVSEWIKLDETGGFVLDQEGNPVFAQEKLDEYITSLASKYDTFNGTRDFKATRGDTITIEGGTYGNKLNQKKEKAYLKEAFLERREEQGRIPEYEKQALYQGSNDIGNTYIEIDMTEQMMYYYQDGKITIRTPVVTGNMARKMGTPARTCFVYAKQKNRILRGPGYASHVNFWMPVNGGIGIHDAKWRKEFGGEIYKKEGSHGCINTPYDVMKELFSVVEVGTPVVMFY